MHITTINIFLFLFFYICIKFIVFIIILSPSSSSFLFKARVRPNYCKRMLFELVRCLSLVFDSEPFKVVFLKP
jgi:hypothetical protein